LLVIDHDHAELLSLGAAFFVVATIYTTVGHAGGDEMRTHTLLGRDGLVLEIANLVSREENVLIWGPRDIGKTALISALPPHYARVLDPFEKVKPRVAAAILRAMDRGISYLTAARSLDRRVLGAVRRIAWRFTTVRVPPLDGRWMRRLVTEEWVRCGLATDVVPTRWTSQALRIARGRPVVAIAIVQAAASIQAVKGVLPSAAVAHIEASIRRVELSARGR
jgi:hypothetical protein